MNRVTVTIAGRAYTLLAEESKEYMDKVAELVNTKIKDAHQNPDLTVEQASVLAAINVADECLKAQDQVESLRSQLQSYIEEIRHLRKQVPKTGKAK
ncbi:MAG: cell division protein ZapA [Clostridiaceae bacterium]|jgi:cell division protein ZapA|nr:cell division protein ZapA [Clostridiaceae bacterium]MCI9483995.1 cell division protein ZapA [Clostridiaceae bacterium]MDE7034932.1 cell division protein ZapA [Eubacteriales bacterium]NBH77361.1 cell division protein ZapA [Clostridiaceae bacterium]NBI83784.1 cell division protein ZapA [Clostridiaceae bacterium]